MPRLREGTVSGVQEKLISYGPFPGDFPRYEIKRPDTGILRSEEALIEENAH